MHEAAKIEFLPATSRGDVILNERTWRRRPLRPRS